MAISLSVLRVFKTRVAAPVAMAAALAACTMTTQVPLSSIGSVAERYEEAATRREYRQCRDEALELDRQAHESASLGRYLSSARLIERCEAGLAQDAGRIPGEERMRLYALSIQNHFKGGDILAARRNLEHFRSAFPNHDLYFTDGSSFIETMELLLGLTDRTAVADLALLNVNGEIKAELRQTNYWQQH